MIPDSYLLKILKKNAITQDERQRLRAKVRPLVREIRRWAGEYFLKIIPSGSFMKGTGILVCPVAGRMANGQKEIREFWNFIMSKSMSRAEKTRQTI